MSMQFPQGSGQGPVLSDNMPKLSAGLTRGVNKTAVAYIVLVSLATIGMTLWVASNAFSADDDKKKQVTYEEVTVRNKPKLAVLPPPPPAEVVAKADMPSLPTEMPQLAEAQAPKDDLMQRRMASEHNLVATQDKGKKNQLFEDEYASVKRGAAGGPGQCRLHADPWNVHPLLAGNQDRVDPARHDLVHRHRAHLLRERAATADRQGVEGHR